MHAAGVVVMLPGDPRSTVELADTPVCSEPDRDQGSSLIMVLAFIVISSLIVIPMLNYATTVLRANSVTVEKREDLEAVRAAARVAVANPVDLFNTCATATAVPLSTPSMPGTTSTCRQVGRVGVRDELQIPIGAASLQLGEPVLTGALESSVASPPGGPIDWWYAMSRPDPATGTIFMPNIPKRETSVQEATGHPMPAPYNCKVYFPGSYAAPIVIDGPTYFTSGVYYFQDTVTVVGGGRVVAGFGVTEGCLDPSNPNVPPVGDLQAVLDMNPAVQPARFNIDGLGATFVFGDKGRLIIDDTRLANGSPNTANRPVSVVFNQRYVENEADGGARVSIMSVNGDRNPVNPAATPVVYTTGPLSISNVISVPESRVITADGSLALASTKGLTPSIHTPEPRAPKAPTITSVDPLGEPTAHDDQQGAAWIKWAAPVGNEEGGSTITKYDVFDQNGTLRCTTTGARECVAMNLAEMNLSRTHTFTVVATNAFGTSAPSAPFSTQVTGSSSRIQAPGAPTNVVAESAAAPPAAPVDAASVRWDAPTFSGHAPIVSYEVKAFRVRTGLVTNIREDTGRSCTTNVFRDQPAPTTCIVGGLPTLDTTPGAGPELTPAIPEIPQTPPSPPIPAVPAVNSTWLGYEFVVTATNAINETHNTSSPLLKSAPSAPSNRTAVHNGSGTVGTAPAPVVPTAPTYVPDPLVDVNLSGGGSSNVVVTGYLSAPMGRVRVVNPNAASNRVSLVGGVVSGTYDVANADTTATKVGFEDAVLQRTIAITTTLAGSNRRSIMTVQINANAADLVVNSWVTQ
ncbi:MAG: hypothetical protein ABJH68_09710 [Ilumatobacter sp.]|uniref:hypothetical protein n=1 Tax=Ilumatobacter sp. TaxID=1967498 RepID=UPI003296D0FA